jgi:hypothetical protein
MMVGLDRLGTQGNENTRTNKKGRFPHRLPLLLLRSLRCSLEHPRRQRADQLAHNLHSCCQRSLEPAETAIFLNVSDLCPEPVLIN